MPVYNSERFLERCVRSILCQQTSVRYEVICINDGSTDGSLRILERLQSEYPELLRVVSQDNQGISVTRNRGIELAKGEYIGFLDNDDYVSEGYVETLWQPCGNLVATPLINGCRYDTDRTSGCKRGG